tara:strand:- start:37 stop:906 length:870 start_codon:yes stop_codon:yes gene_type:complete
MPKSKKNEDDEDEDLNSEPEEPTKAKKSKKRKEPEDEEDEDVELDDGTKKKKKRPSTAKTPEEKEKDKIMSERAHKKFSGYRKLAVRAGYNEKGGRNGSQGFDPTMSLLSSADAKRLLRFFPEVLNKSSYSSEECYERMLLCEEPVPKSAARTAQAHLEVVFRWAMNQSLMNAIESGRRRVDAQDMFQALRRLDSSLKYTAVLPAKGLLKYALNTSAYEEMKANEDDEKNEGEEKKQNSKIAQKFAKHKAAIKQKKDEEKAQRDADKQAEKEKAKAAAMVDDQAVVAGA